jgi:3-hydroxybutyryl-CoA dehydrogenase
MSARFAVDRITTVAVLGAGTMGHGIAHIAASAGARVRLYDVTLAAAEQGVARIGVNLQKGVDLGKVSAAARADAMTRIAATDQLAAACDGAEVVVEAIPEVLALKQDLFAKVDRVSRPDALLATNTSSLPVAELARTLADPSRMVGMHFFNPVHVMKLVEVVRHATSDASAVTCAVDWSLRMGKTAITVSDSPGFASSRLGLVIGLEAMRMVEQGVASAADIDTAMKLGYGHPMGPLELTDLVGLDVRLGIAEYLAQAIGPGFAPPTILKEMVMAGKLGKKSGEGFYQWDASGKRK